MLRFLENSKNDIERGSWSFKICFNFGNTSNKPKRRHGDNGNYLYFATTGLKLNYQDENIDVENLGNSTLVTFMVITLVLLVGYIIDGVEIIQDSILEVNEHCWKDY